ncbi:DUF1501 domain-containing protein [Parvularcula sp. ZS-1/3]|uniref:DUF1501 domain-containing protein n=1 Tax=Parvularcula mediterranea TaxID=2732508 RepID=A0A7Y3RM75_9PROT|nr:DUF1501 domain-containing protein [Parvularcula mediterranea]NNU16170.1 DUF1501 domain-containing protein [Parvularcula mediterranea]
MLSRRSFLHRSAAAMGATALSPLAARASVGGDYKALVCLLFEGGLDNHEMLIGYDQSSYNDWSGSRKLIMDAFDEAGLGSTRERSGLVPLTPQAGNSFGTRQFAMPPEAAELAQLFNDGKMAFVPNVGTLIEPVSRQQVMDGSAILPPRLQSHNDQESYWLSLQTEGSQYGWGGRFLDATNGSAGFGGFSASRQSVFLSGRESRQLQVRNGKARTAFGATGSVLGTSELPPRIREWYGRAGGSARNNVLMRDIMEKQSQAIVDMNFVSQSLKGETFGDQVIIPGNGLSEQFAGVANMIAQREAFGVNRQIFFVSIGGFDTHANHVDRLPDKIRTFSQALKAFQDAIDGAGLSHNVTTFTTSDFGRTLTSNSTGTDHGWGSHHMVMGGAVNGGGIYGDVAPYVVDHDRDYRRGALIPDTAVEQYASDLGRWFGISEADLDTILPNRGNFDRLPLGFINTAA